MGILIQKNDSKSEFQSKLESELNEKLKKQSNLSGDSLTDINDFSYLKDTKKTTSLAWAWLLVLLLFIFAVLRLLTS